MIIGNEVVSSEEDVVSTADLEEDLFVLADGDVQRLLVVLCKLAKSVWVLAGLQTFSGSSVHKTNSSTSSSSSSSEPSSLSSLSSPVAIAFPFLLFLAGTSSMSSSDSSPFLIDSMSCLSAASFLAFFDLAGSLGPASSSLSSESLPPNKARMYSASSSSDSSSPWSTLDRMIFRVALGVVFSAPSSKIGLAVGSMAAMVIRNCAVELAYL